MSTGSNACNYTDYGGGYHQMADLGCVWLFVLGSKLCGRGFSL